MKKITLTLVFVLLVLLPGMARAETFLNLSVSAPDGVWRNEQTSMPVYCAFVNVTGNTTEIVTQGTSRFYGEILDNNGRTVATLPEKLDQISYSYVLPNLETGFYDVTITCKGNITENGTTTQMENSSSFQIKVRAVNISLIGFSPESPYSDSNIILYTSLKETIESEKYLTGNDIGSDKWDVYYQSANIGLTPVYNYNYNRWEIPLNRNLNSGTQEIRVVVNYEGKDIPLTKSVYIYPSYEFYISGVSPVDLVKGQDVSITLRSTYHNSSILNKIIGHVSLRLGGETINYTKTGDNRLVFSAPDFRPGSYRLEVVVDYTGDVNGDGETEYITGESTKAVEYLVPFHGEVTDALGKSLSGTIKLAGKNGYTKRVNIRNGEYSESVPKGTYTINLLNLPNLRSATFTEVEITEEMSNIFKYDSFSDVNIPGLKTVAGVALEFSPGFKGLTMSIIYSASKVKDETAIRVYKCSNWNIDARFCSDTWEEINAGVDTFSNTITIETTTLSAFIVGEMVGLSIEGRLDKKEYYSGGEAELTGVVKDVDGKAVKGGVVKYEAGSITGEAQTNSEGIFSKQFKVPEQEGTYNLSLSLSGSFHKKTVLGIEFSVKKKRELSFILPINANVEEGDNVTLGFSLLNSGQTVLKNVQISVSGMPEGWYEFSPKLFKEISPGEEGKVSVRVRPYNATGESYIVSVKAESDEIEKSDNFVLFVKGGKQQEEPTTNATEPVFNLDLEPITAYFVANRTGLVNAFSVLVSALVIFLLLSRVRRKASNIRRENILNLAKSIKQEVLKGRERGVNKKTQRKLRKTKGRKSRKK